ncbi:ryanodine receptor isoform X3 [Haemaphysalis longicornis]
MGDSEGSSEQDDVSFLRTDDMVCLQCTATGTRVCLAAEGFGNRHCYLENIADKNFPPEMLSCVLVLEQALSVRALQEMVTAANSDTGKGTQSGHRTLLYGHAVLLRHQNSNMYLACLSSSSYNDKLAFDVGLQDHCQGEACWWTIHPASKQRSEGEKVRVGDDLILVSVATERYLHTAKEGEATIVNASFHLTHWSVAPFGTGTSRTKNVGYVFGGEVLRFFHGGDECLTIPPNWSEETGQNIIVYEGGAVLNQARSLWRLELVRTKWAGGFVNWGYPLRIHHITTGQYLAFGDNREVCLVPRERATVAATAFCLRQTKDDKKIVLDEKEEEVLGSPLVKYGDTTVFLQHLETGLWLSYKTYETKKRGVGKVEEKQAIMSEEGKMDDGLEFSRAQVEESRTARVIRKCGSLFNKFIVNLDAMQSGAGRQDSAISNIDQDEMIMCFEDLINYFVQPEDDIEHEEKQNKLKALRNRQDLFQEEGILNLILETIDKINAITTSGYLVSLDGEDASQNWDTISGFLYQLLAAIIKGNHTNCAQFAQPHRLDWLFSRLSGQQASEGTGMLDVLHCVLIDSPEALNILKEDHIKVIISLLEKHGRDPKVLDVLCSLCVTGKGVAVRSSQNNICDNLLPGRNLLLQTRLVDHVASMQPNIFVGKVEGAALFRRWYYEAMVDHCEQASHLPPHLRIGWANTSGYVPYPGGGSKWGGNGLGDDLYSFGFDGCCLWTGGRCNTVRSCSPPYIRKGDVIGCIIDLNVPVISFSVNGIKVKGCFRNFNTDGMFYPAISFSAKLSCRFLLGGDQGKLRYGPPDGHSALVEALLPQQVLTVEPCFQFGDVPKGVLFGPAQISDDAVFVPSPVDTSGITLPNYIESVRDKLAENVHEVWAMNKIDSGWRYADVRDDARKLHPCLTSFEHLPLAEKKYDTTLALQTLKTILALGYHITVDKPPARIKTVKLPNDPYLQSNGYKPAPLDLGAISLTAKMEELVDLLSENTHNVWAQERIQQGWTYGLVENQPTRRSPHLVPYKTVDDIIKKANRDTAGELVRTLLAYGYVLEPPTAESLEGMQSKVSSVKYDQRTYRAETTYAVTGGKWYFEFEVLTLGPMKVGWASASSFLPSCELGGDANSWAYDGFLAVKNHAGGAESYGKQWTIGDVIGCMLDLHDRTISFSLNGELLLDNLGGEAAFSEIPCGEGASYVPACTFGIGQKAKLVFGHDVNLLRFFTTCGLQEGYQPFCVNMNRNMTFWYNKDEPMFVNVDDAFSPNVEVNRIPAGGECPPALKITHKLFESVEKVNYEFLRLSLPVCCRDHLVEEQDKEHRWEEVRRRQRRAQAEKQSVRHPANLEHHMLRSGFSMSDVKDLQRGYSDEGGDTEDVMPVDHRPPTPQQRRRSMLTPRGTTGTLTKTQSFDAATTLQVPDGSRPDASRLRAASSEEALHRVGQKSKAGQRTKAVTPEPESKSKRRGKSPFRFFRKKEDKEDAQAAASATTATSPKGGAAQQGLSPPLLTVRPPSVHRLSPAPSNQLLCPPVPERPTSLSSPTSSGGSGGSGSAGMPRSGSFRRPSLTPGPPPVAADDTGDRLDPTVLDLVDEYFYGLRVFPGQDPNHVYVGWVTTAYKFYDRTFGNSKVRKVAFHGLSEDGLVHQVLERQNCYMVCAGQLAAEISQGDAAGRSANQGMYVGCHIDVSTGLLTFSADGHVTRQRFKMEPGTKLFPAAFFEATSKEVIQFELGRTPTTLPLSAVLLHTTSKHLTPQCPPRLKVQCLQPYVWARVPNVSLRPHALRLSEVRGWSMLCDDPVSMLALHIPEEDRCIDVLELIEHERLLNFHAHTLSLYGSLCFQGNHRAAHMICSHVDEKQLMYAIQSEYLSGPLRTGFTDLLISLHLEFHAYARSLTQNEFIVPLGPDIRALYEDPTTAQSFSTLECVSIRPEMSFSETREKVESIADLSTPYFPVDALKQFVIEALAEAVKRDSRPNRDPIGGSNENLFVPLLKLADKLLLVGLLDNTDLQWLLYLLDPNTFEPCRGIGGPAAVTGGDSSAPTGGVGGNGNGGVPLGLIDMQIAEGVKLQVCYILHHLCDLQLRHRVEAIVCFSDDFVNNLQSDQLRRYIEIKQSDLPSSVAAKKTREFRCTPKEQMRAILGFKNIEEESSDQCPCGEGLREVLSGFHEELVGRLKAASADQEAPAESESDSGSTLRQKLMSLVKLVQSSDEAKGDGDERVTLPEEIFTRKVVQIVVKWAEQSEIEDREVVRQMFRLLLRVYSSVGELMNALENTYVISHRSQSDIISVLSHLGKVRALLPVQMSPLEEEVMRKSLWALVNNRIFFQHPDLIRVLRVNENVMDVMINTLGKRAQTQSSGQATAVAASPASPSAPEAAPADKDTSHEMVVSCCRFLCYFCRTSRQNQKAMFDHLDFLLENSNILLSRPSLRGSTPLDVAYSSLMENSELALALREHYLEKIAAYMSRCGLQSNLELVDRGYPDVGWDPVEGERYLDFLRFCVWVNGETVEENANLVIRLLIRRPECLGPALRGEGPGLLDAIREAVRMSERITAERQQQQQQGTLTEELGEDDIDMGAAILNFYCTLVDLLGRCAPEAATIAQGKNESIRARAILRSLVPLDDLLGALSLRFTLQQPRKGDTSQNKSDLPAGLQPNHKQSIVMFLERVYGLETQETFFRLLEDGFLPDLRAATMLDRADSVESDMALALNRYIGNSVLPMLIQYYAYFTNAENYASLLDATLHTVYRLSKVKILTKGQREKVSDFLVALTREMQPSMLLRLLRKLTVDVSVITEYTAVALRLLTLHYDRCKSYYSASGGQGAYGTASEEERRLTMLLFTNIFDSLSKMEYDPDLFSKALPCLTAIACALPPDYSLTEGHEEDLCKHTTGASGPYVPEPVNTMGIQLNQDLNNIVQRFSEHFHDAWAMRKLERGWQYGERWNDEAKTHPRVKPYNLLTDYEKERYRDPIRELLKALLAFGWKLELTDNSQRSNAPIAAQAQSPMAYMPTPVDMSTLTLNKDMMTMAERLAENTHDIWAKKMKEELEAVGGGIHAQLVPYDLLTDREKYKNRDRAQEFLKFLQYEGYRLSSKALRRRERGGAPSEEPQAPSQGQNASPERRFASSLLEKLLQYLDVAAINLKVLRPSVPFSRRTSFKTSSRDVKFFSKVVLPLMEKVFVAQRAFFLMSPTATSTVGTATIREKEMVASLFCKLGGLLRAKFSVFGNECKLTVSCLQTLIRATDAKAIVKNCPDFVKTSMLTYFNNAADDLATTLLNLQQGRYSHLRGTTMKTSSSLNYVQLVLLPVLTALFDHMAANEFGSDLLLSDIQVACYKILNSLYTLGTNMELHGGRNFVKAELERHRPAYGNCLGAFAATFPVAFLEPSHNKHNPYCIHGKAQEHSLEAQAVMATLESSMPTLEDLMGQVEKFVTANGKYLEQPFIIEVMIPMLCSYLPFWWSQGPDNVNPTSGNHVTMVTSDHLTGLLKNILNLLRKTVATEGSPWMITIAGHAGQIVINSSEELLRDPILPMMEKIRQCADSVFHNEECMRSYLKSSTDDTSQVEGQLQEEFTLLVRDIYAFFPLLIKYVDLQRNHWLKNNVKEAEQVYTCVAHVFNTWNKSQYFRREEANFISQHEIDNMALIMPSSGRGRTSVQNLDAGQSQKKEKKKKRDGKRDKDKELAASLVVACLKRLLPVGLNLFAGREQELVQHAKEKFLNKDQDSDIFDYVKLQLTLPDKIDPSDAMSWQHYLYSKLGSQRTTPVGPNAIVPVVSQDRLVERIIDMAKVLFGLHVIDHPQGSQKGVYRSVVSTQRKRAVIACFRMISLHSLPRHRAINIFLNVYKDLWLEEENVDQEKLIDDLTTTFEESEKEPKSEETEEKPDPLVQLVVAFSRKATTEHSGVNPEDPLYMHYAFIFSQSCGGAEEEEEEEEGDEDSGPSIHQKFRRLKEQELEKQRLLFQQARLASRGVAEMALLYISACKGCQGPMVIETLKLGISLLKGGNQEVQMRMLQHLKEKKDVGFFTSIAGLMNSCSVLDLDAFERTQKAEGLGVGAEGTAGEKNMHDADFTCALFRFLQLLCEGHNLEFQNYLRTQAGNTTTVNVVISTVDYLLRLQESIMDFYWHYSSKEVIDQPGKDNFCRAITVAKQVFNTLTEFIQGPCSLNQQALAHSRLWDAVTGFLFLFAHMQDKLSKNSSQLDLLKELLELQKEMVIMMLSMLEGNVMNGTIGKQMVDTLVESASNVELILRFFDMFLKLKELTSSSSFQEIDSKNSGWILPKDFQKAMEQQKIYNAEEISFLMSCCEPNIDDLIDYREFTERFHNPAKDIGFNLAVLLTNLSEHMPNDPRLQRFLETASSVLNYFEPFLGRIEIMGSSRRIERVYFEIKESTIDQWEKPQIKESKRAFFYSIVTEGGDKEKLEAFVNFCEDAIFEMQHASSISNEDTDEPPAKAEPYTFLGAEDSRPPGPLEPLKQGFWLLRDGIGALLSVLRPSNIRRQYQKLRSMTMGEIILGTFKVSFFGFFYIIWMIFAFARSVVRVTLRLMGGQPLVGSAVPEEDARGLKYSGLGAIGPPLALEAGPSAMGAGLAGTGLPAEADMAPHMRAFGLDITKTEEDGEVKYHVAPPKSTLSPQSSLDDADQTTEEDTSKGSPHDKGSPDGELPDGLPLDGQATVLEGDLKTKDMGQETADGDIKRATMPSPEMAAMMSAAQMAAAEPPKPTETPPVAAIDLSEYSQKIVSFLARNFYNMKYIALVLAFFINCILLFYKVSTGESAADDDVAAAAEAAAEALSDDEGGVGGLAEVLANATEALSDADGSGSDEEVEEWVIIEEKLFYLEPIIRFMALFHSLVSFCMLIAYYHLKVPLAIFKREKEVARAMEFDGLYITEDPAEDDIRTRWDKLVISTKSFPVNYWDKFVKKRVRQKYSETYDPEALSNVLGLDKSGSFSQEHDESSGLFSFITNVDWKYQIWKSGVTITDNAFLYNLWYFVFSVMGNLNFFFFAAHLLDVAVGFKTLRTILQSVTHNGKQLVLTVMLLTIVVYIYTVIAFSFFRKFYIQEEDEQVDHKCHSMLTCFVFHLYKGVRAGGGIGDEIEPPDGDDYEVYRIIFDITFFFFVIIILLAIIQGLIIDAFGELRDQLQSVVDDMESNCFICGIGKDYFDRVPHGFDTHVQKEHNLANYMFFLMHLINKPDTEYTGQETYVWELYQKRCWDFFPVGDCFRKQYEDELMGAG